MTRVRKFGDAQIFEAPDDAPCAACWLVGNHVASEHEYGVMFVELLESGEIRRVELLGRANGMRLIGCEQTSEALARYEISKGASS